MKNLTSFARNLGRVIALAATGLLALAGSADAASFRMECRVNGYSTAGWIQVRPGSNTGGRVQHDAAGYYTDRVQRGEPIRVIISPSAPSEYCNGGAVVGARWDNGSTLIGWGWLPLLLTGNVPTNVNVDHVVLQVQTSAGRFESKMPIGTR